MTSHPWYHTQIALERFKNNFQCTKCHSYQEELMRYETCEHLFCSSCVPSTTHCPICTIPMEHNKFHANDIVSNLLKYSNILAQIISKSDTQHNKHVKRDLDISHNRSLSFPKNINKVDGKGETRLHAASRLGKVDVVQSLLECGANPNTKDHAGWTPLQEVINLGSYEICKLLLENGAQPNIPGLENRTALHEAVILGRNQEVELLLKYNADINACDFLGKTPLDYVTSEKIRDMLENYKCLDITLDKTFESASNIIGNSNTIPISNTTCILGLNLSSESYEFLHEVARKHKIKIVKIFTSTITHVVVEVNDQNITSLNYDILLAILHGKWILSSQWIRLCMTFADLGEIELSLFEVRGTSGARTSNTPSRARENAERQNPRLFDGCFFFFAMNSRNTYSLGDLAFTKSTLSRLVTEGHGKVLSREPNPEEIQSTPRAIPFHVAREAAHPLYKCSHFIIYVPGKDEPTVKYNMTHIKSLPLIWLIESIEQFMLLDPSHIGIPL